MVTLVAHPTTGAIITVNPNKPAYGTVRLDSEESVLNGGFFDIRKRVTFVSGPMEALQKTFKKAGQVFEGKIIMIESFNPFYEGQKPKMNPQTQQVVLVQGKPVYMEYEWDRTGQLHDHWVDNIVATAENAQQAEETVATNQPVVNVPAQGAF